MRNAGRYRPGINLCTMVMDGVSDCVKVDVLCLSMNGASGSCSRSGSGSSSTRSVSLVHCVSEALVVLRAPIALRLHAGAAER